MQVLIEALGIRLSELLVGKYSLHDIVLVLFFDKAALDTQTLLSAVLADGVGDFFHPNTLLPLL